MRLNREKLLLYAVTDELYIDKNNIYSKIENAIRGGVTCIQYRNKSANDIDFLKECYIIKDICTTYNVPFIVNDNVKVAIKCNADAIHVGQNDMCAYDVRQAIGNKMALGVSTQTVEQSILAQKNGADYLGVGAVFNTTTKLDASDVSHSTLKEICSSVDIPVVAIGGINNENIPKLYNTGICGVALVSAIFASDDITKECKNLLKVCKGLV